MASVNIEKLHGSAAASILAHNHRHDGKDVEYANKHIDKNKISTNGSRYFNGIHGKNINAHDDYERLRRRVEEIDAQEPPKRIRRDRVTMIAFEIPVPEGLPPEQESAFFSIAYRQFARMCGGAKNVSTLRIHRDEVHEYTDPITKERKTSRVHAHCVGIPYVPGKGVNCKAFMSRQALRDLQAAIDQRCRSELGVAFLDGSRQRSRGSVEDLKLASAKAEEERALAERIAAQEAHIREQEARLQELQQTTVKAAQEASRARQLAEEYRREAGEAYEDLFQAGTLGLMVNYVEKHHQRDFELWAFDRGRTAEDIDRAVRSAREWSGPEL